MDANQVVKAQAYSLHAPSVRGVMDSDYALDVLQGYGVVASSPLYKQYIKTVDDPKISKDRRCMFTCMVLQSMFEILKQHNVDNFFIRSRKQADPVLFERMNKEQLEVWAKGWHSLFFGLQMGREIRDLVETVIKSIPSDDMIDGVDKAYIQVTDSIIWCRDKAEFRKLNTFEKRPRIFARCFDTVYADRNVVKIDSFSEEQELEMEMVYWETITKLRSGERPMDLQPLIDWSQGNQEVYWDLMYMFASPFMKTLPVGAFFPVGVGRNGKSAAIGLAQTLIGQRNCSAVPAEQMGSWDYRDDLMSTWLNCPSEISTKFLKENTEDFKKITAHELHASRTKFGTGSTPIVCDFMCIFPINQIPEFDEDSTACVSRMLVVPFNADFSSKDTAVDNYAETTFRDDAMFMPKFAGEVFATAYYFSRNKWELSGSMNTERTMLNEYAAPNQLYYKNFRRFFKGYTKINLVQDDFVNYCKLNSLRGDRNMIRANDLLFKNYKRTFRVTKSNKRATLYKIQDNGSTSRFIMEDSFRHDTLTNGKALADFHEAGGSLLYELESMFMAEWGGRVANKDLLNNPDQTADSYLYKNFLPKLIEGMGKVWK